MKNLVWFLLFISFLFVCGCSAVSKEVEESNDIDGLTYYEEDAGNPKVDPLVKKNRILDLGARLNRDRAANRKDPIPLEKFVDGTWKEYYKENK